MTPLTVVVAYGCDENLTVLSAPRSLLMDLAHFEWEDLVCDDPIPPETGVWVWSGWHSGGEYYGAYIKRASIFTEFPGGP
jgi:hypothetical protein